MNQLGKIFDALEKFREQKKEAASARPFNAVADKPAPADNGALEKTTAEPVEVRPDGSDQTLKATEADNVDPNMIVLFEPHSFEAEQFKILRTKLLFPSSGKPARSIMVTSTVPGEGKSFVSANLSISIAQNIQEHVLIIDCDVRMPSIHKCFGIGEVPGLSEYLANKVPLESLMLKTKIDKLSILPAGHPPHNPSELLSSPKMSDLLKEVKARYSDRYIIIDSPPPLLTAETHAISHQVDGILLVVKYGSTPRKMVLELIENIGKEKIIGVVFNNFDIRSTNYLGYKKYGKYGKTSRYHTKYHK